MPVPQQPAASRPSSAEAQPAFDAVGDVRVPVAQPVEPVVGQVELRALGRGLELDRQPGRRGRVGGPVGTDEVPVQDDALSWDELDDLRLHAAEVVALAVLVPDAETAADALVDLCLAHGEARRGEPLDHELRSSQAR